MKYLHEYRDSSLVAALSERICSLATRSWRIMEVCGGQTHTIVRAGLDRCLGPDVSFVHGPGCPVCVTPAATIDFARSLALRPNTILCTFGDMVRVPGTQKSLAETKSDGGNIRILYSPIDAITVARENPTCEVVLFAIGFETTAPLTALAILQTAELKLRNFSVLCAHVLIPPAVAAVLQLPGPRIDALLAPGHVCTISGTSAFTALVEQFDLPIVVTGFEPVDLLQGTLDAVTMLESDAPKLMNSYRRAVCDGGNVEATRLVDSVFRVADRDWRGLGTIANSGLEIREEYGQLDASVRFSRELTKDIEHHDKPCGRVLSGQLAPSACPHFADECRPERPIGAPMVSSEGACAAYFGARNTRGPFTADLPR